MNIKDLKRLAGINEFKGLEQVTAENMSITANDLKHKEKQMGIKPGTDEWFKLWFSKPYMTGPVQFRSRKK